MSVLTGTITVYASVAGIGVNATTTRTGGGGAPHLIQLPAGLAGSAAWGGSSAVITFAAAHGLTDADKVGVFWGASSRRLGMTISAYDTLTITVTNSTGEGDSVPTSSTADVVVGEEISAPDADFDPDSTVMFIATCEQKAAANYIDSDDTSLMIHDVLNAGDSLTWAKDSGIDMPLGETVNAVADVKAYNGSTIAATYTFVALLVT